MTGPRGAWESVHVRPRLAIFSGISAAILVVVGSLVVLTPRTAPQQALAAPPPSAARPSAAPSSTMRATPSPSDAATPGPTPSPTPVTESLLGKDGRLTVLLLGSDRRPGHPGDRSDTIMVISVNPTNGAVAAASIPRDTTGFPLPDGTKFRPKVNELYERYVSQIGESNAGAAMSRTVGRALRVEIDNYVVIGFEGVTRLVDAVGGVDIVLDKAVRDPGYWLSSTKRGVSFPAGKNHLNGERALIFARTRKADNDFERARRQQKLLAAVVGSVRKVGLLELPKLISIASDYVKTDLPLARAPEIFDIVASAKTKKAKGVVFGPRTWAQSNGTSFSLKIGAVRDWTARWMGPVTRASDAP